MAAAGVKVGAVLTALTVSVKLALVVVPQLSVARTVMVCVPAGARLDRETTPLAAPTEIVPV